MKRTWKKQVGFVICILILICFTGGCSAAEEIPSQPEEVVKVMPGAYDSIDTALVVGNNKEKRSITFLNLVLKKNYTLTYDGTTGFFDKYGTPISADQLEKGEIVETRFLKGQKLLSSVQISPEIWSFREVKNFELDLKAGRVKILDKYYNLQEDTVILSENEQVVANR